MNMLVEQVRADLLAFSRRPETLFFTVFLPVIFLVLFEAIFGGQSVTLACARTADCLGHGGPYHRLVALPLDAAAELG